MANYNSGQVKVATPGSNTALSLTQGSRRLYDFSDRIADLAPEESPFFVYLSKVGKVPTTDSQFRFLEDRTKIAMTDRTFTTSSNLGAIAEGDSDTMTVSSSPWLIKGMVIMVDADVGGGEKGSFTARVESVSTDGRTIEVKFLNMPVDDTDIDGSSTNVQYQPYVHVI